MHSVLRLRIRIRPPRWNQDIADVAMGLALAALAIVTSAQEGVQLDVVSVPLLLLQTLPVAVRRRDPMRVLLVTGITIILYSLLPYKETTSFFGVLVAFYTVAANEPRRRAARAAIITFIGIGVSYGAYALFSGMPNWVESAATAYLSFGLAWVIGDNLRVRRAYTRELEERAAELEREREDRSGRAVGEERRRIARELHDVVAHYVSVMVVQAAAARRIGEKDPAAGRAALEAVEVAGRTALAEMRRMLEVLREDDSGVGPQPGLGDLERLIGQVRDAGVPVELRVEGNTCCLPAGMDLAAYRIVQEALTNTVKHGGKANATVTIRYGTEMLEIEVTDDGRGAAAPLLHDSEGGHGLIGMKERVALFGGKLTAGPVLTGGYRVTARLPIEPDDSARARSEREAVLASIERTPRQPESERPAPPAPPEDQRPRRRSAPAELMSRTRSIPPLMIRVVPPHRPERQDEHGRLERGGQ